MKSKAHRDRGGQSPRSSSKPVTRSRVPRAIRRVLDRVVERDGAYFLKHPECREYTRRYVPGEFHPYSLSRDQTVLVRAVSWDVRIRQVGRLVMVDCLSPEAVHLAPAFLPTAGLVAVLEDDAFTMPRGVQPEVGTPRHSAREP
jgi:hypothetical protein